MEQLYIVNNFAQFIVDFFSFRLAQIACGFRSVEGYKYLFYLVAYLMMQTRDVTNSEFSEYRITGVYPVRHSKITIVLIKLFMY